MENAMRFKIDQDELNKALSFVSRAVTARSTMPVLKGILMKVDSEGMLTMTASDMEFTIEKKIPVRESEPGEIVIPAKIFGDVIRKLPGYEINLVLEDNNNIHISTISGDFRIIGMEPGDFPEVGSTDLHSKIRIDRAKFRQMVNETAFAASIDKSKGVIVGVLMETKGDSINMVALDGFRMSVATEKIEDQGENDIIISARIISDINKMIGETEDDDMLELMFDEHKAVILSEDSRIIVRRIEGKYLDYRRLLPESFNTNVVVDRVSFIDCIERASLFAKEGRNNLIKLTFTGDNLLINSRSDAGDVDEHIPCRIEGPDIEIGFNSKYLLEGLKVIESDSVVFRLESNVKPCIIQPVESQDYRYLILPVRIIS